VRNFVLSKLKTMFRQAAQRSVEELWTNIDEFLESLHTRETSDRHAPRGLCLKLDEFGSRNVLRDSIFRQNDPKIVITQPRL
jgi:hypothetical protein